MGDFHGQDLTYPFAISDPDPGPLVLQNPDPDPGPLVLQKKKILAK